MKTKICEHCKKSFHLPKNVSLSNWKIRKFCTRKCKTLSSRGKPSWNAGKCPPFEITNEYREKMKKIALSKGYGKWMKGKKLTYKQKQLRKEKIGDKNIGKNHPMWKGGKQIGSDGYILKHAPNHPNKMKRNSVREHRLVVEKALGRYLNSKEVVHHINEDKKDNRIENLYLFSNDKEHLAYHRGKEKKPLISNII